MVEESSGGGLAASVDRPRRFQGTAWAGKPWATLELPNEAALVYIDGLRSWDEWGPGLAGSVVSVIGTLRRRRLLPAFRVSDTGAVNQGAVGEQYVLEGARLVPDRDGR